MTVPLTLRIPDQFSNSRVRPDVAYKCGDDYAYPPSAAVASPSRIASWCCVKKRSSATFAKRPNAETASERAEAASSNFTSVPPAALKTRCATTSSA